MASTYVVDVDLAQLREHRSKVEKRQLSDEDVRSWLKTYGFCPRLDGLYLAEDRALSLLEPSEIIAARAVGYLLH
jgi:hypothetical protein